MQLEICLRVRLKLLFLQIWNYFCQVGQNPSGKAENCSRISSILQVILLRCRIVCSCLFAEVNSTLHYFEFCSNCFADIDLSESWEHKNSKFAFTFKEKMRKLQTILDMLNSHSLIPNLGLQSQWLGGFNFYQYA